MNQRKPKKERKEVNGRSTETSKKDIRLKETMKSTSPLNLRRRRNSLKKTAMKGKSDLLFVDKQLF